MKQLLISITIAVIIVIITVFGFTWDQANQERVSLSADLKNRTNLLADSLKESIEPYYLVNSRDAIQKIIDKFTNRERLLGLAVYDSKGIKIAASEDLTDEIINDKKTVSVAMDRNIPADNFVRVATSSYYALVVPLHQDTRLAGAFMVVQNAEYIDDAVSQIWKDNLVRLSVQSVLFLLIIGTVLWFFIYRPLKKMIESAKLARIGKTGENLLDIKNHFFFQPLAKEISKMAASLFEARRSASEEARMRLEKIDTPWTAERLKEFIKAYLKNRPIFVVSNREPYVHEKIKNEIVCSVVPSGMNTAVNSMMEACGGVWIAYGSGSADKETADASGKLIVPPDDPKYTLKRIWLSEKEVKGYYSFSVEAMYPLCLMTYTRPVFRKEDWLMYKKVNGKFAQAILSEIKGLDRPIILIQDYHFAILPQMIKASRPDAQIALFWHVPWPSAEAFSVCPWRKEILNGMTGADLIGFNTQQFCNNFIETEGKEIESLIDFEQFAITRDNHTSYIKTFPISIDFTNTAGTENNSKMDTSESRILKGLNIKSKYFGLGVDRLDYAKGIPERFKGIEVFLDSHPEYIGQLTFLQIASPHREHIEKYKEYQQLVTNESERVNKKFGTGDWKPIILEKVQYTHDQLTELFKAANFCLISSLHDSMNLVAKEYVAARGDEQGVLILSQFAGASRDMKGALIINPHNIEEIAEAINKAINMAPIEQRRRMKIMRNNVRDYNVYRWAAELIKSVANLG